MTGFKYSLLFLFLVPFIAMLQDIFTKIRLQICLVVNFSVVWPKGQNTINIVDYASICWFGVVIDWYKEVNIIYCNNIV